MREGEFLYFNKINYKWDIKKLWVIFFGKYKKSDEIIYNINKLNIKYVDNIYIICRNLNF